MSTYAQIICGFEEDGLGGLRVLGDYAIVSDGKLNFDFPAKKENAKRKGAERQAFRAVVLCIF